MSYLHRNLLPLTVGLLATVAIVIGAGNLVMRFVSGGQISDERFDRELDRRLDGATQGTSATLGLQLDAELKVASVLTNGPGATAGIKAGDRLVAINGVEVKTVDDARARLATVPQNTDYAVTVNRSGARVDLKAKKGSAAGNLGGLLQRFTEQVPQFGRAADSGTPAATATPPVSPSAPTTGPVLGIALQPTAGGLLVLSVTPNSPAAQAGVVAQDVLISANGRATGNAEGLQSILQAAGAGGSVTLLVRRDGQMLTLTAQLVPRT